MTKHIFAVRSQAAGAWPNGIRVIKVPSIDDEEDQHQAGALATIIGSVATNGLVPEMPQAKFLYCVIWDDMPGIPFFVADFKVGRVIERPN